MAATRTQGITVAFRPRFADCAARYLVESQHKRSVGVVTWHVRLLGPYVGALEANRVHDRTLEPFVADRLAAGVTATTINRSLEVVRTILNRAARSYRDDEGRPWLDALPPLITMLPETPRLPYPITWEEQDRLFPKLSARLGRMALFAVNTGLRESNVCGLEWAWEVGVPEVDRSVFVIPPEAFKSKRAHVVILNDAAWSIVQAQRGLDPIRVFPHRGRLCSAVIRVAADPGFTTPTMRPPRLSQASIRGASRPRSTSQGRVHPPLIDIGTQTSGLPPIPSEDPARQVPTRCADAPNCNESSTLAESSGDVLRTSESANRGTPDVLFRSPARRSSSPSDSRPATAILRRPGL